MRAVQPLHLPHSPIAFRKGRPTARSPAAGLPRAPAGVQLVPRDAGFGPSLTMAGRGQSPLESHSHLFVYCWVI